jgi:hypothetical protein
MINLIRVTQAEMTDANLFNDEVKEHFIEQKMVVNVVTVMY